MNEGYSASQIPYELKAPTSGMGALDPRSAILLWGLGSICMGLLIMFLLVRGEFRFLLLTLLGLLTVASLAPRRGVYILTAFLPFMYFVRRAVLNFQEFSQRDPILLFPAITTAAMTLGVLIFYGPRMLYYFRRSALLKTCCLLMGIFLLQVFNPLQGSLLVGLAGAMFFLVPMLWLFLGLIISREDMSRILRMVLVIGCITSLYGIYQRYFGLSAVEIYELNSKGFLKTFGGISEARVMSTFSGLVDFARYLTISGFLAFAYFWRHKKHLSLLALVALQLYAMLFTASRTSFLVVIFSMAMLVIVGGGRMRDVTIRGLAASLVVVLLYGWAYQHDARTIYRRGRSADPFVVHTLSGVTHPTQESTFKTRLNSWAFVVSSTFTEYPVGRGLGSTTTAATKFEGGQRYEADSYFFELFYGSGILAPILFIAISVMGLRLLLKLSLEYPNAYLHRICFGFFCGFLLSSVFGISPRDTITGPLAWLMIGWIVREYVDWRQGEVGRSAVRLVES